MTTRTFVGVPVRRADCTAPGAFDDAPAPQPARARVRVRGMATRMAGIISSLRLTPITIGRRPDGRVTQTRSSNERNRRSARLAPGGAGPRAGRPAPGGGAHPGPAATPG